MKSKDPDDLAIKVTDFGFACFLKSKDGLNDVIGSPIYMAPEIIDKKKYGASVDIWAAGVLLHILIAGKPPFSGETKEEIYEQIMTRELKLQGKAWEDVSTNCKDIVT